MPLGLHWAMPEGPHHGPTVATQEDGDNCVVSSGNAMPFEMQQGHSVGMHENSCCLSQMDSSMRWVQAPIQPLHEGWRELQACLWLL